MNFFRQIIDLRKKLALRKTEIEKLEANERMNKKYEKKFLEKLNQQNTSLQVFKKMLTKQINKNTELQNINKKINQRLMFYVKNRKINIDEFDDLADENLADKKVVEVVQKWLHLRDKKVDKLDFFDPQLMLEDEDEDLKKKDEEDDGHIKFGHLEVEMGCLIPRPHVLKKSHSTNFDVRVNNFKPSSNHCQF